MARTNNNPEARLERLFVKQATSRGALCFKFLSPDNPGVPDQLVILPDGRTVYVELKVEMGRLASVQKYQRERLQAQNAQVWVLQGRAAIEAFMEEVLPE